MLTCTFDLLKSCELITGGEYARKIIRCTINAHLNFALPETFALIIGCEYALKIIRHIIDAPMIFSPFEILRTNNRIKVCLEDNQMHN